MAESPQKETSHITVNDACRLCDKTFTDKKDKHNLIIGAQEVKPAYTLALEEITGPVKTTDDRIAVCSSCRTLLNRYHRSSCEVKRIGTLVKSMSLARAAARVKRVKRSTTTDDARVRKRINIEHGSLARRSLGFSEVHISVFPINNIPWVKRCTACCTQFHCPLCPSAKYKARSEARVLQHVELHVKNAIQHEDLLITKCHHTCRSGSSGHFHCPSCLKTVIRRMDFTNHLQTCRVPAAEQGDGQENEGPEAAPDEGQETV